MGAGRPRLFVVHTAGRADIGVKPGPGSTPLVEQLLTRLEAAAPEGRCQLLLLSAPEQDAGEVAPLASAARQLDPTGDLDAHLLILTTEDRETARIARQVERGVRDHRDLYGVVMSSVALLSCRSLEEPDVQRVLGRHLVELSLTPYDRIAVIWGSGSTQLVVDALDAVVASGSPWSLVEVSPEREARPRTYDPTTGLTVDPLVPLLRRWRCHDLLHDLHQRSLLQVSEEQARRIEQEAAWWGNGYVQPSVEGLRALMAAALMRRDGSSGFAVRAYVEHRYRALLARDNEGRRKNDKYVNLLAWVDGGLKQPRSTLGQKLGGLQQLVRSLESSSGQWLLSSRVRMLNEFGALSSHERQGPPASYLRELRKELEEETVAAAADTPFNELPLVPADRVWYVALVGKERASEITEQIADAATDPARCGALDRRVRRYLGAEGNEPLTLGFLLLGTRSQSAGNAAAIEERLNMRFNTRRGCSAQAVSAVVADQDPAGNRIGVTEADAYDLLDQHLGEDTAAIVLVPTGPKPLVLSFMAAAQRLAATRGIPLYLRQLVNERKEVEKAEPHRLPLRFGTDEAILTAALHAMDSGELDTAARLLGTTSDGSRAPDQGGSLAERVAALSHAVRCDLSLRVEWPPALGKAAADPLQATLGLMPQRVALWTKLSQVAADAATQSRAVIGACASIEQSIKRFAWDALGDKKLKDKYQQQARTGAIAQLFKVRNCLPISHENELPGGTVDGLVRQLTNGAFPTTVALLTAAAAAAESVVPAIRNTAQAAGHLPPGEADLPQQREPGAQSRAHSATLPGLYERLCAEMRQMLEDERARRRQAPAAGKPRLSPSA